MNKAHRTELDRLASDGFVKLDRRCDASRVARMLESSQQRVVVVRAALGSREIGIGSAAGYAEIVQRSPGRWDVPVTPQQFEIVDSDMPWWSLITTVLGADAEHAFSGVVSSEPRSPEQCWHIDSPHVAPEHLPAHALNVMVALHDIPMAMGPTECARGSHRLTNHLKNAALVPDELIYQHAGTSPASIVSATGQAVPEGCAGPMAAGDCLVFDDRILHRGLANRTDQARHVAYFSYRVRGYSSNTHFESQRSVFDPRA